MCALFIPDILQAVAVKWLNHNSMEHHPTANGFFFFFFPEKQSEPLPSSLRHKGVKPPHLIQTHKRLKRTLILMDCTKLVQIFGICPFFKMTGKRRKMKILYLSGICLDLVLKH